MRRRRARNCLRRPSIRFERNTIWPIIFHELRSGHIPDKRSYVHYHFVPKKRLQHQSNYPRISNVQATTLGLITWTTDIASTSQVHFGTSPLLAVFTSFDGTLVTNHSVQLTGLTSGVLYYFRVQSFFSDALSISDLYTFQFQATPAFILLEDGTFMLLEDGTKIRLESP